MNATETTLGYTAKALATIAKVDIPASYRLARIIRKASAKDSNGMESQGCHVPTYSWNADHMSNDIIRAYMEQCIMDVQDKCIRKVTDGGRNIITDSDISMDALAIFLEETDENIGRISKDRIAAWFDASLADTLMLAFAERLGVSDNATPDQVRKLEQVCRGYKDVFAGLAAKAPSVEPKVGASLLKAVDMIPADAFSLRVRGIIERAMAQPEVDLLAL